VAETAGARKPQHEPEYVPLGPLPAPLDAGREDAFMLRRRNLGARFKICYGVGAIVDGITSTSLTYFLLFYLTAVCGLSGTLAGVSSMLALTIDAIADPAIGLVSDNTRSRLGRRLPYLLYSTIPLAVSFVMLFSIPPALKGLTLFGYATVCSMALRFALSLFNLPYFAVGAEVTDDYAERTSIVSYRICLQMLGTFCAIALGLGVFMSGADGVLNRQAYNPFAWTCAALILLAGYVSARAVKAELPRLHSAKAMEGTILRQFLRELAEVFRNRSFIILFCATAAFFVASGAYGALALYANRYFWSLPTPTIQLLLVGVTLGPFIGAPLNTVLSRFFEKLSLTIGSLVIFSLSLLWPPLLRIADLLPLSGTPMISILFANALLSGASLVGAAIGFQSMMADAADEHEYLFGVRREGLFFSGITLAVKAASGLGGLVAGVALDLIHFPTEIAQNASTLQLPHAVVRDLGLVSGPLPAAITLLAPLALLAYGLSKAKHAAILADLERRRKLA
jgi:glycoside/pentoside/hexuronide:cation symporter, GPH family